MLSKEVIVVVLINLLLTTWTPVSAQTPIKLCVLKEKLDDCQQLMKFSSDLNVDLSCVPARDRIECMHKVKDKDANVLALTSGQAYAAYIGFKLIPLLEEKTTSDSTFQYEAVAVVRKTSNIDSLEKLKGGTSCHTGYKRTAGWEIPLSILYAQDVMGSENCGDDLGSVSTFFKSSCVPGNWSFDALENRGLKMRYPNLCKLCANKCNPAPEDEDYMGYYGALRCLVANNADVAFTKWSAVKDFAETHPNFAEDYSLLCANGTLAPVTDSTCFLAARPNPLIVVSEGLSHEERDNIIKDLQKIVNKGKTPRDDFFVETLLTFSNSSTLQTTTLNMKEYLEKGQFSLALDKPSKCQESYVKLCVISTVAKSKCEDLKVAAFSKKLRPQVECILAENEEECLKMVASDKADATLVGAGSIYRGQVHHGLKPLMAEVYEGTRDYSYYAVAVIPSNSTIKSLDELEGKRACHSHFMCSGGWRVPVGIMAQKGFLSGTGCSLTGEMEKFFGDSCAAGATADSSLCAGCHGDRHGDKKCTRQDEYFGHKGAFRCLVEGAGDVAFIHQNVVLELTDKEPGQSKKWANGLKSTSFRLLCVNGDVRPVAEFETCNWGKLPPKQFLISGKLDIYHGKPNLMKRFFIRLSGVLGKDSKLFRMFAEYNKMDSVLFTHGAIGVRLNPDNSSAQDILGDDLFSILETSDCNAGNSVVQGAFVVLVSLALSLAWFLRK